MKRLITCLLLTAIVGCGSQDTKTSSPDTNANNNNQSAPGTAAETKSEKPAPPLIETETCNGRGAGGLPKGAYITREFLDSIKDGAACIAVMTFLRFNDKYKVKPPHVFPRVSSACTWKSRNCRPWVTDSCKNRQPWSPCYLRSGRPRRIQQTANSRPAPSSFFTTVNLSAIQASLATGRRSASSKRSTNSHLKND